MPPSREEMDDNLDEHFGFECRDDESLFADLSDSQVQRIRRHPARECLGGSGRHPAATAARR